MSSYGGRGPTVNAALWTETAIASVFVFSRVYTRVFILRSAGWDDLLLLITLLLFALYAAFISAGTAYGIGQRRADIPHEGYIEAHKFEIIGQAVCIFNIATSKAAVASFLLRIVRVWWHRLFIWIVMVTTALISTWCTIAVFIQCIPVRKVWDFTAEGNCWLDFAKVGLATSAYAVAADFVLAITPIFILWDLNMKRKDKVLTIFGLGLGVFAGVCGILRTTALTSLRSFDEYIFETIDMLIYSGTENFVSIICASIPVLRPLWIKARGYESSSDNSGKRSYQMSRFGSRDPESALETNGQGRIATRVFSSGRHNMSEVDTGSQEIILQGTNKDGKDGAQVYCRTDISISYST